MSEFEFIDEEVQKATRRPRGHNWLALCNPEESEEVRNSICSPPRPTLNNNESSRTPTSARQTMEDIEFPKEPANAADLQTVAQDVPCSSQSPSSDAEQNETDPVGSPVAAEPTPDDTKLAVKRSASPIAAHTPPRRLRLDRLAADHPMEDVEFSVEQANAADLQTVAQDVQRRSQPPSPAARNAEDGTDLVDPSVAANPQATSRRRGRPPKTDTSHGTQAVPRVPNRRNPIPAINDNATDSNGSGGKRVSTRLTKSASKKNKADAETMALLEQVEKRGDEAHLAVRQDEKRGQYLITLVDLVKGDFVVEYKGATISRKEALKQERILDAKNDRTCTLFYYQDVKDGKTRAIDSSGGVGKARFVRQSKAEANLVAKVMDLNGTKVIFLAKCDISANLELFVDYGGTWQAAVKANPSAATAPEPTPDDANLAVPIVAPNAPRNSQSLSPDADAEDETDLADPPVAAVAADSPNVVQNDPDLRQALSPIAESPVDVALDVPCSSQSASSDAEKDETDLVNSPVAAVAAGSPIVTQNDPGLGEPLSPAADDTVSSRTFQSQRRADVHAVADAEDNPCCSQSSLAPDADDSEVGSVLTDLSTVVVDLQANSNFSRSWNSEKSRGEQAAAQVLTDQNPFPTIDEIETGSELHGELAIAGLPAELRIDDTGLEELPTVASDIPDVAQDDPGLHQPLSPAAEPAVDDTELAASSTEEDNSGHTPPSIDAADFQAVVQDVPCSSQSSSSDAEKDETDLADSPVAAVVSGLPAVTQKDPGLGEPFSSAAEPAVDDLEFAAPSTAVCSEPIHTPQRAPSAECEEDNTGFTNPSIIDDLDVLVQEDVPCSFQSPSSDAEKDETDLADSPVDADAADSPAVNQIPRRWNTPRIRKEETEKRAHAKLLRQFSEKADEKHLKVFEDESNPGKGQCLMTLVPLAKGDLVAEYRGPILSYSKAVELEKELEEKQDMRCYFLFFYDTKKQRKRVVDSTKSHGRARFVNHSKTGANVEAKVIEVNGETKVVFIATTDIASGSEILLDYKDNRPSVIEANPFLKE